MYVYYVTYLVNSLNGAHHEVLIPQAQCIGEEKCKDPYFPTYIHTYIHAYIHACSHS